MEHVYQRRVHFADTDAAGVVHFSRILCYAEEAEHDLLTSLGIPLMGNGGWPRVQVSCDYTAPVKAGDALSVTISPDQLGNSSIRWSFAISCGGTDVARGEMKTVRVDSAGNATKLDESWRAALLS